MLIPPRTQSYYSAKTRRKKKKKERKKKESALVSTAFVRRPRNISDTHKNNI